MLVGKHENVHQNAWWIFDEPPFDCENTSIRDFQLFLTSWSRISCKWFKVTPTLHIYRKRNWIKCNGWLEYSLFGLLHFSCNLFSLSLFMELSAQHQVLLFDQNRRIFSLYPSFFWTLCFSYMGILGWDFGAFITLHKSVFGREANNWPLEQLYLLCYLLGGLVDLTRIDISFLHHYNGMCWLLWF